MSTTRLSPGFRFDPTGRLWCFSPERDALAEGAAAGGTRSVAGDPDEIRGTVLGPVTRRLRAPGRGRVRPR